VFKDTYKDDYANFKEGVAESICEIAFLLDEHDVTDELIPILIELMKDKSSGVKIKVVEGLVKLSKVLGPKMFSKDMIESFNNLLKEEAWRVRLSIYDLMGEIGKNFG
jgi:vesicle coat complex subunit